LDLITVLSLFLALTSIMESSGGLIDLSKDVVRDGIEAARAAYT